MQCECATTTVEVERLIGTGQLQTRLNAETATPGAGREVIDVLIEQADITIDSIQPQTDAVVVDGELFCQAVYRQGENTAARAVTAQTRFSEVVELEGVTPQSIVKAQGVVEEVTAGYENGRMRFEMSITIRVQAHQLTPIDVITEISGVDGVQTRFIQVNSCKLAAESNQAVVVSEEVALPAQLDARVALMDWATARVTSTAPDLGGVKVQGEICSQTLIGTGVSSRPLAMVKVVMPFEQLVEMPEWLANDVTAEASVRRLDAGISPGEDDEGAVLRIEGEANIYVRSDHEDAATALEDAYATGDAQLDVERENINFAVGKQLIDCSEQFRGTLMLSEDAPGVGVVLATRANPVISQWTSENGITTVEGFLDIKSLYLPSGSEQVTSVRGEMPFSVRCNADWPEDAWVNVTAMGCEAAALMSDRLEIRLTLVITGFYRLTSGATLATKVEAGEAKAGKSGIVIYWPNDGDDSWTVARRYRLPLSKAPENIKPGTPVVLSV
ncbi:MAG: DUF3794 domain-containing protein [Clostridia bacterium]|nr:DUF3794 domain-containing protein [Clostridia bacterium]